MNNIQEEFYSCPDCGFVLQIWRKKGRFRGKGHQKWLFCVECNEMKNFTKVVESMQE